MTVGHKVRWVGGDDSTIGFQIAPMVDVVFVVMLFFMVMVGSLKVERELRLELPGWFVKFTGDASPTELTLRIENEGQVLLNDEPFDTPSVVGLPKLTTNLLRAKQEADARGAKVLVTLEVEEQARYERIISVLNAMAKARISNVTFTVGTDEGF